MQNNNRVKNNDATQNINTFSQSATFEVLAGLFSTLSDGLATVAAALAIQEAQQQAVYDNKNAQEIQQQLNYLTKEVKKITKALNL